MPNDDTPQLAAKADFSDQTGFFDPEKFGHKLTVIGCGGIGASALPTFASLGIPVIEIWDPDVVEPRNMASQLMYWPEHMLQPKVQVCKDLLEAYGVGEVIAHQEEFTPEHADTLDGIVICAVDTMSARQMIWKAVDDALGSVMLFMDGRIGGEQLELITIDPLDDDHTTWYQKFKLFDDADAPELPCAERAVIYPAVALGAFMVSHLTRVMRGQDVPRNLYMNMNGPSGMALELLK